MIFDDSNANFKGLSYRSKASPETPRDIHQIEVSRGAKQQTPCHHFFTDIMNGGSGFFCLFPSFLFHILHVCVFFFF